MNNLAPLKITFQLVFSSLVVLGALLFTWLIMGESSPLHNYFIWHGDLPNAWAVTIMIPYIVSALISGNPHSPSMVLFIIALVIQWYLFGFLLSIPMSKPLGRLQKK